ncbi:GGDEF domain-containing protein [Halobacillus sp. ACCC02827]|uniref:GGDEF domain-containing protein n=1 Tax=Bacillaceae TaxID=186817 RepID=UPI0002A4D799|nr:MULTISPECIES: GGDEF domain-containing protein [Bacillaceae]ELK48090.1 putative signaling protein [Halobacillus sp. BAB-2008]QHT45608.1 diguanylate cyclase [Bacillus sp. SB49]WJE16405.1 GGDEF domain-containing protein [Halobacillus sp. ACCC02827]
MKWNYLWIMFAFYLVLGCIIGGLFVQFMPKVIPIPQDLQWFFTFSSITAGLLLGLINFFVFYFFIHWFLNYHKRLFRSIKEGDLSVRSHMRSSGSLALFTNGVNDTLDTLQTTQRFVTTDDLTGLLNRSALQRDVLELKKGERMHLFFLDLDDFKQINDRHGHLAGDAALKHFVAVLHETMDEAGTLYRYGGDEFILIYEGNADTNDVRSKVHLALEEPLLFHEQELRINVSIGLCSFTAGEQDLLSVINEADNLMYEVKQGKSVQKILTL